MLEITLVGIGNILGAGIYLLMGKSAGLAGNMVWFVVITSSAVAPGLAGTSATIWERIFNSCSKHVIYCIFSQLSLEVVTYGLVLIGIGILIVLLRTRKRDLPAKY